MPKHQVGGCDVDKPGPSLPLNHCARPGLCAQPAAGPQGGHLSGSLFIPATLPLLKKVLELRLGKGQRASLPQGEDPSRCSTINASLLTKNGSDWLHPRTAPSTGPGRSFTLQRGRNRPLRAAGRNVLLVHGLPSGCWAFAIDFCNIGRRS